jgi:hypothetical protein
MVVNVQIRQALLELTKDEDAGIHQTIAETCLQYLQRDSVKVKEGGDASSPLYNGL